VVPVQATCGMCGWQAESEDAYAVCAKCGGTDVSIEGGDELILESIQLAAPA